jgi:hypothetical protein
LTVLALVLLLEALELLLLVGSLAGLLQEVVRVGDVVLERLHSVDLGPQNMYNIYLLRMQSKNPFKMRIRIRTRFSL